MNESIIEDLETHLRAVHAQTDKLYEWIGSEDQFVKDIIDLVKATHLMGFAEALESMSKMITDMANNLENE